VTSELHVHDWSPWGPSPLSETTGVERRQRACRGCELYQDEPTPAAAVDAGMDSAIEAAAKALAHQDCLLPDHRHKLRAEAALAAAVPHIERATLERLAAMTNVDGAPYRATMWLDWAAEQFGVELHTDAISILYEPPVARGGEATE
jgi:hypothetical protein